MHMVLISRPEQDVKLLPSHLTRVRGKLVTCRNELRLVVGNRPPQFHSLCLHYTHRRVWERRRQKMIKEALKGLLFAAALYILLSLPIALVEILCRLR